MTPTTSQGQLRRREAGWEGSRRRNRDPRNTWRIAAAHGRDGLRVGGGAVWAIQLGMAKPAVIKRPSRGRGGCARKVAGLTWGGLRGCPRCPVRMAREVVRCLVRSVRGVGRDSDVREDVVRRGEVSRGRITSGDYYRWEGPNAKPSARTFVLVVVAVIAANPVRGLAGKVQR